MHTYGSGEFFISAAPTAQNSSELHFRFINSFIQPSRVGSLIVANSKLCYYQNGKFLMDSIEQASKLGKLDCFGNATKALTKYEWPKMKRD